MKKTNFRKFKTASNKMVFAGKTDSNNEQLIKQVQPEEIVLHTAKPGSPFCNIKSEKQGEKQILKPTKKDIREAAIFCAAYSQAWKKPKTKPKQINVHYFKGKDIYKNKAMKLGTFGVKKFKEIIIKKKDIEDFEKKRK